MNKRIAFLTGTRVDFGKLRPLMDKEDNIWKVSLQKQFIDLDV